MGLLQNNQKGRLRTCTALPLKIFLAIVPFHRIMIAFDECWNFWEKQLDFSSILFAFKCLRKGAWFTSPYLKDTLREPRSTAENYIGETVLKMRVDCAHWFEWKTDPIWILREMGKSLFSLFREFLFSWSSAWCRQYCVFAEAFIKLRPFFFEPRNDNFQYKAESECMPIFSWSTDAFGYL